MPSAVKADSDTAHRLVVERDSLTYLFTRAYIATALILVFGFALVGKLLTALCVVAVATWLLLQLRARARRMLTYRVITGLQRVCGYRGELTPDKVKTSLRWSGWWTGYPLRVRAYYESFVDDDGVELESGIIAVLNRRFGGNYRVRRRKRSALWIEFEHRDPEPAPPEPAETVVRAERIIQTMLKTDVPVTVHVDENTAEIVAIEFELTPEVATKLTTATAKHRFERAFNALLPGRWRVHLDLEHDHVRIEQRPRMPPVLPHPAPAALASDGHGERPAHQIVDVLTEDGEWGFWDLRRSPHKLTVGDTGSGKTVSVIGDVLEFAARGWPVRICDAKGTGYLGLRGWPNVQIVATNLLEQIAVVYDTRREMQRRYDLIISGQATADDFVPMLIVFDEYWEFVDEVDDWWAEVKTRGMPSKCPVSKQWSSLGRKAREARIHILLASQRPDGAIMTTRLRDQFGCRRTFGPTSREVSRMMWKNDYLGSVLPPGTPGRCIALSPDGRPVEAQGFWTPDPRKVGAGDSPLIEAENLAVLESLRPAQVDHPPLRLDTTGHADHEFYSSDGMPRAWLALTQTPLIPVEGRPALAGEAPAPQPRERIVVAGTSPRELSPWPATPEPQEHDEADMAGEDGYDEPTELDPEELEPGDLVLIDEEEDTWAVVESVEPDLFDGDVMCIAYRAAGDESGLLEKPADQKVSARQRVEDAAA